MSIPRPSRSEPESPIAPLRRRGVWALIGVGMVAFATLLVVIRASRHSIDDVDNQPRRTHPPSADVTEVRPRVESQAVLPLTDRAAIRLSSLGDGVSASPEDWPSEAFSEAATARLQQLATWATHDGNSEEALSQIVDETFASGPLRPRQLDQAYESDAVIVRRATDIGPPPRSITGVTVLARLLHELFATVREQPRMALKIIRVELADEFHTVVHAEGGGRTAVGRKQWTATWNCVWSADVANPRLHSITVVDYEEVESPHRQEPWLVDVTGAILGEADGYRDQLLFGMDYWVNRLEHRLHVNRLGHHGLALGDVNGDGLDDLYVCQPGGLPNRLYLHQPDGTARLSGPAGVDILDDTTAALLVDLDNDGDQDLALLTVGGGFLFSNDGHGLFELRTALPACRNAFSITAADYDADGLLDLYVGRYWPEESVRGAIPLPVPYYDALNGGANVLLKNEGEWRFTDVTQLVGLDVDNTRYTMAAAWEDFDNDGDQDLYVANDFGRNCLYRNDGGRFVNIASAAGVEDTAAGMSVSWSDYNHDGNMDIYVGNMFSSAGNRIAYQRQYAERFDAEARSKVQRLARGNSLFSNQGGDRFADVSLPAAVNMGRWAWGSVFTDLNNDAWDDLVVANGHVTTQDPGDL